MKPNFVFVVDDPLVQKILEGSFGPRGISLVTEPAPPGTSPIRLDGLTPDLARALAASLPPPSRSGPSSHLNAQRQVTDAFLENGPRRDLMVRVVRALAENLGFDFATVWTVAPPAARLTCAETWSRTPDRHAELRLLTQGVSFAPGTDVVGLVWERGKSVWVEDVSANEHFLRASVAARVGLVSAVTVPFRGGERASGVLELLSTAPRPFDQRTLALVEHVAIQLGTYLDRMDAEERRGLLAGALEATTEIVAVLDRDGRLLDINHAGRRLLGLASGVPVAGRELPQPDYARRFFHDTALATTLRDGSWTGETVLIDPVAGEVSVLTELVAHRNHDQVVRHVFATLRGIDELVSVKRRVWQAEKLDALARLSGAVANDFNNLLTVITGYSTLVADTLDRNDPRREHLAQLELASQQAGTLIHQLATIGAQPAGERAPVDVWAMLHDMTRLVRSIAGPGIEVMLVRESPESLVLADPVQLEQIVVNLVDNARDAMPRGGRLTIELSLSRFEVGDEANRTIPPGTYVVLSVSDTGVGIAPSAQGRLFEPFFTTKRGSRGLGLASVLGTARQAGGNVTLESQPGRGATFRVYLPRLDAAAVPVQAPVTRTESAGTETVLIVEDEAGVRALARRALERSGYTVLEAETGAAAVALCASHPGPIHIALVDMVMPGMGGGELSEHLAQLRPDTRVLFMTGHSASASTLSRELAPGIAFLEKPFVPSALVRAVRTALDRILPLRPARRG